MSEKIRFLHTADLHLGAAVSSSASIAAQRRSEALLTLEHIFSVAREKKIPLLLFAGDLLENNSVDAKYFETFLRCVNDNGDKTVVFAAGNHDPLTADSPFLNTELPKNLIVLGGEDSCVKLENMPVRIYGKSFSSVYMKGKSNFTIPAENDECLNIMVLHGDIGYDLDGNYNTVTKGFIECSGMDYIALGHVHALMPPQRIGKTYFAYPGTPEPHGFDETGAKGVIIGEIGKLDLSYEFLPTSHRTYEVAEIDVTNAVGSLEISTLILKELQECFGANFKDKLYKIILTGEIEESIKIDTAEITARLSDLYFVKIRDNTKPLVDLDLLKNENSLKGRFVSLMLEKIEAAEDTEREKYKTALDIGLKAFNAEVKYDEN